MIVERLEVGPFASNCYIVGSESTGEGMIIDPGADSEEILKKVKDLGLSVKVIVLTHGHVDHITALTEVKVATGAEFAVHADEVALLSRQHGGGLMASLGLISGISDSPPTDPDRLLNGGDSIDVGDLHFLVLHTPGHSPGGICLLGHGVVFTGDTLFQFSVGRTDFPGCSHSQLMDSIHTKLMVLPDDTIVHPGHGPETTIGTERQWNPFVRGQV